MAVRDQIVLRADGSSGAGTNAKRGKIAAGNQLSFRCRLDAAVYAHIESRRRVGRELRENFVLFAHQAELLVGESAFEGRALPMHQEQQTIGILHGQHSPHDGVDEAEDGGVRDDAQRERERHRGREAWALAQDPKGIAYVLYEGFDQSHAARPPAFLFYLFEPAQRAPGLARGFFPVDTRAHKLFHLALEMEPQFIVELGFDSLAPKECPDSIEQII